MGAEKLYKIPVEVPKEMARIAHIAAEDNKPYDICHECPYISETCDGPNILSMSNERWVEWARTRLKKKGITHERWSEESGVPLGTIRSIMSGKTLDARHSTIRELTRVLVGGCWGQYPCHVVSLLMQDKLETVDDDPEVVELRKKLEDANDKLNQRSYVAESDQRAIVFLKEQIAFLDGQVKEKAESIRRKEKMIVRLFWVIAVILILIVIALVADSSLPDMGWIRSAAAMIM